MKELVLFFHHIELMDSMCLPDFRGKYLYPQSHHTSPKCFSVKYYLFPPKYWGSDLGPYSWYADSTTGP